MTNKSELDHLIKNATKKTCKILKKASSKQKPFSLFPAIIATLLTIGGGRGINRSRYWDAE